MEDAFSPRELKKIEVDIARKIFSVNGKDFGKGCTGFNIECKPDGFSVRVEIDTEVVYSTYSRTGKLKESRNYQTNEPWFSVAANGLNEQRNDKEGESRNDNPVCENVRSRKGM